jgi:hypothetical protein
VGRGSEQAVRPGPLPRPSDPLLVNGQLPRDQPRARAAGLVGVRNHLTLLAVSILGRAGESLGSFLPRLGGALALLLIGVLLVRLVARLLVKAMQGGGLDDLAERGGVHDALDRAGLGRSLA